MPVRPRIRVALRRALTAAFAAPVLATLALPAAAHGGSLGGAARESASVPSWLLVGTGGAVVGASFLLSSFATDRSLVDSVRARRERVPLPAESVASAAARLFGVAVLAGVVVTGFFGPSDPISNPAVVVVWVGWWAGFAASTYLVGNAWPALDPWRAIAGALPRVGRTYAWRYGAWPSVAGLLALVWLEVVSPLADDPRALATTVLAYSIVTLAGAAVYGTETWFRRVDPVARVFRYYGAVAPVGRDDDGSLQVRLPGAALTGDLVDGLDEAAFVVALLWVTTYDGLVATPAWRDVARTLVDAGVPPMVLYPAALVLGFGVFFGAYLLAARLARRTASTFVASETLARRFAPPLLAIAAGYHLAHFLGYFLVRIPALELALTAPMETVDPRLFVLPDWYGLVGVAGVLVGHLLAVVAAHATAFDLFPGRLQAIRSQYPFIAVMICYTMVSLWIVTRPTVQPPFLIGG